jgi:RNA 3'-terminal phosphate cyclase (ATP)
MTASRDLVTLDGSLGEGGGQVLRSALTLSLVTGRAFRIENIRSRRSRPGLLAQHLCAVEAAALVGEARVDGAGLGSTALTFTPEGVRGGSLRFAVGTAGSATLVLQTVLPALAMAPSPSALVLEGGTHNPHAPSFEFLAYAYLPLVERMGPRVRARLERPGFFPVGGGRFTVEVEPAARLVAFDLLERGALVRTSARALVANLPRHVAEREVAVLARELAIDPAHVAVDEVRRARGQGNACFVFIESQALVEVFTGIGERGVRAEAVAQRTAGAARRYLAAEVPVGEHLADQLLLLYALAGRGAFCTLPPTGHTRTQVEVIGKFLDVAVRLESEGPERWRVEVG